MNLTSRMDRNQHTFFFFQIQFKSLTDRITDSGVPHSTTFHFHQHQLIFHCFNFHVCKRERERVRWSGCGSVHELILNIECIQPLSAIEFNSDQCSHFLWSSQSFAGNYCYNAIYLTSHSPFYLFIYFSIRFLVKPCLLMFN